MHLHGSVLILALLASGCEAASIPDASEHGPPAAVPEAPRAISRGAAVPEPPSSPDFLQGLECDGAARACTAPGFAISGSADACEPEGASFGAISDDRAVDAVSRFQGNETVATLAPGQFVCIHYTAQPTTEDGEPWLYVTAISPREVPACTTTHCGDPNARSEWSSASPAPCTVQGNRYGPGCPAGWVRGTSVDAYSMGL